MGIKVKDLNRTASKWAERASGASGAYAEGVQNPKRDWADSTIAAADSYKTGVTKAANENRFAGGVRRAGTDKQQRAALSKGVNRYSEGVAQAQPDYATGMEPVLATLANVNLPPRGPKGSPQNIKRVEAVDAAQHAARLARQR